jgi:PII-like signaling protein
VVVEIIDEESKLKAFVHEIKSDLNSMGKGFLITLEPVDILMDIQGAP